MNRLIRPIGEAWNTDGAAASAIAAWERESRLRLPDDYRDFMRGYNGGRPYPNIFRHTAFDAQEFANPSESYLDPFYHWDRVATWSKELGNRLPPDTLTIGADPGLLEIVLSLRQDDHGAIYSWVRNWGVWGSADNSYLCRQAPSFRAFVESLYDDNERNGYDYWHRPRRQHLERELRIQL